MNLTRATALTVLLGSSGMAGAASMNPAGPQTEGLSKASSWIGTNVEDRSGNNVGEVRDLAIDWRSGKVAYAVVAIEKWMHIDSKLVAIQPNRLQVDPDGKHVVVQMTESEVNALPAIDEHDMPVAANESGATHPRLNDNRADDRDGLSDQRADDDRGGESEAAGQSSTQSPGGAGESPTGSSRAPSAGQPSSTRASSGGSASGSVTGQSPTDRSSTNEPTGPSTQSGSHSHSGQSASPQDSDDDSSND